MHSVLGSRTTTTITLTKVSVFSAAFSADDERVVTTSCNEARLWYVNVEKRSPEEIAKIIGMRVR